VGSYNPADTAPIGWIGFRSSTPFSRVKMSMPPAPMAATDFMVDNVVASTVPSLKLVQSAPNAILVSWTTNSDGFVLQQNAALGTVNWVSVTNAINTVGAEYQVSISPLSARSFFRLLHP
jgi:hypothetical protein